MDNDRFARTIKNARLKKGYTQSQLADLLNVSNKTISKWETGRGYPDITLLAKITSVLKLDYEELLQSNEYIIQKRKKKRKDIFIISIVCFIFAITLIGTYKVQKQQKYETDIFKNKKVEQQANAIQEEKSLIKYKENIFQKIISKIKNWFKK